MLKVLTRVFRYVDVSTDLHPETHQADFILALDSSSTSIFIPQYTCNGHDFDMLNFSRFSLVESIVIEGNSFGSVNIFKIDGLHRLKSLKIGKNSFTSLKEGNWEWKYLINLPNSFHVLNCESLESIEIGEYSFSDYGEFELKNLPQLQSIELQSFSFHWSKCVIEGSDASFL